jgi:hypothetical protein
MVVALVTPVVFCAKATEKCNKNTKISLDIQPPETIYSVPRCRDKLRVFLAISGNTLSMTLVPQDISHPSKAQKSRWKKMGWCLRCKHATPQTPEILTMN